MLNRSGSTNVIGGLALAVIVGVVIGAVASGGGGFGGKCDGVLSAGMSEVLDANAYPWTRFQDDLKDAGDLDPMAEHDHKLKDKNGADANVTADIFRINSKSGSRKASCFDDKVIVVGLIYPRADFQDLYLKGAANNYFVVWRNTKEPELTQWHGAILNDTARNPIPFTFKKHPKKDDDPTPPDNLNDPYKECWKNQQRACFGEVPPPMPPPPPAPGLGLGFGLGVFRPGGGSQPWVSCAQYGCCCGGASCHN